MPRTVPTLPPAEGKLRVVIDTDAACEIDDVYALALALCRPDRFEIEGIVAAHWGDHGGPTGIERSYDVIVETVQAAGRTGEFPILKGSDPFRYKRQVEPSEGVDFIVDRAKVSDSRPLWVVNLGACTNMAMAWVKDPSIADDVVCLWHGRTLWPAKCENFNAHNDLRAVQVLFESELPLWLFDTGTYIRASMDQTEQWLAPHGRLGAFLQDYRRRQDWFQNGDKGFFDLGDIAAMIDADLVESEVNFVPQVAPDTSYQHTKRHGQMLRTYQIRTQPTWDLLSSALQSWATNP